MSHSTTAAKRRPVIKTAALALACAASLLASAGVRAATPDPVEDPWSIDVMGWTEKRFFGAQVDALTKAPSVPDAGPWQGLVSALAPAAPVIDLGRLLKFSADSDRYATWLLRDHSFAQLVEGFRAAGRDVSPLAVRVEAWVDNCRRAIYRRMVDGVKEPPAYPCHQAEVEARQSYQQLGLDGLQALGSALLDGGFKDKRAYFGVGRSNDVYLRWQQPYLAAKRRIAVAYLVLHRAAVAARHGQSYLDEADDPIAQLSAGLWVNPHELEPITDGRRSLFEAAKALVVGKPAPIVHPLLPVSLDELRDILRVTQPADRIDALIGRIENPVAGLNGS